MSKDIEIEIPDRFDEEFVSAAKKLEELVKGDIIELSHAAQHLEDVGNDADIFNDAADITR